MRFKWRVLTSVNGLPLNPRYKNIMKLIELFGKSLLVLCATVALAFTVGCDKGDGGGGEEPAPKAGEEAAPEGGGDAAGGAEEKPKG